MKLSAKGTIPRDPSKCLGGGGGGVQIRMKLSIKLTVRRDPSK